MRTILPRYPNKSIVMGMDIFPTDSGLINDGKMKVQNQFALVSSATLPEPKTSTESFWTTPFGATLSVGLVVGGLYYLGKNMGVSK
jgi:hypothetical protein